MSEPSILDLVLCATGNHAWGRDAHHGKNPPPARLARCTCVRCGHEEHHYREDSFLRQCKFCFLYQSELTQQPRPSYLLWML